jgi:hypothetical protein
MERSPRGERLNRQCEYCGGVFSVHPYRYDTAKFCSVKCKHFWMASTSEELLKMNQNTKSKKCSKCGEIKDKSEFYKKKTNTDGFDSWCKACKLKDNKAYCERNRPIKKKYRKSYHIKNREKHLIQSKANNIRIKYGITLEEYNNLLLSQNSCCAICGSKIGGKTARLDHCHKTMKIRGFLCDLCNSGLGMFKDRVDLLKKAIEYLSIGMC